MTEISWVLCSQKTLIVSYVSRLFSDSFIFIAEYVWMSMHSTNLNHWTNDSYMRYWIIRSSSNSYDLWMCGYLLIISSFFLSKLQWVASWDCTLLAFVFHIVRTQPTRYLNYSIPNYSEAPKMYTLIHLIRKKCLTTDYLGPISDFVAGN